MASLVLAVLFRVPPLVNAAAINSDAAIVGLQTRHFLKGDWALQLWGSGYQTAVESLLLIPFFAIGGSRPIFVFLIPLLGMLAMIVIVHRLLRDHLSDAMAFACTLPLVFATQAINSPMTFIMRQIMVTCLMAGVLLLSRASKGGVFAAQRYFWGGLVFATSVVIDTFALELFPAALLLIVLCASDGLVDQGRVKVSLRREKRVLTRRIGSALAGMACALVVAFACGQLGSLRPRPATAAIAGGAVATAPRPETVLEHLGGNWRLFSDCAPFAIGAKSWLPGTAVPSPEWDMPALVRIAFGMGAGLFVFLIVSAVPLALSNKVPWAIRRLGLFGFFCGLTAVAAFLVTGAPKDIWSTRYLAPLMWFSPLAIAPALSMLRPKTALAAIGAWAIGACACGWVAYGTFVDGPRVRLDARGAAVAEREVLALLRERGVHEAYAQYWLAYRLSLLFEEDPLVVPLDPADDRRAALRVQVERAKRAAMIFHPSVPRNTPGPYREAARASGALEEEIHVEDFTILIVRQ